MKTECRGICLGLLLVLLAGTCSAAPAAKAADETVQTANTASTASSASTANSTSTAKPLAAKLYPPSSQLTSWPMRVFVNRDLPDDPPPRLTLQFGHAVLKEDGSSCNDIPAAHVARNQSWSGGANVDGQDTAHTGTWLLFQLKQEKCKIPMFKPVVRAHAMLTWTDGGKPCAECAILSPLNINLGHAPSAIGYSIATLLAFTAVILVVVWICKCSVIGFFLSEGRLSLSMVQMALWTYAVGFVVLYELFVRLDAADIPASLIVLMTSSLLTAGISSTLNDPPKPAEGRAAAARQVTPALHQPIRVRLLELFTLPDDPADGSKLSLSRVQMLFWTVVIIMMFVSKSLLSEALWDIPWALVALMGVSQLGYLGGKYGYAPSTPR